MVQQHIGSATQVSFLLSITYHINIPTILLYIPTYLPIVQYVCKYIWYIWHHHHNSYKNRRCSSGWLLLLLYCWHAGSLGALYAKMIPCFAQEVSKNHRCLQLYSSIKQRRRRVVVVYSPPPFFSYFPLSLACVLSAFLCNTTTGAPHGPLYKGYINTCRDHKSRVSRTLYYICQIAGPAEFHCVYSINTSTIAHCITSKTKHRSTTAAKNAATYSCCSQPFNHRHQVFKPIEILIGTDIFYISAYKGYSYS